LIDTHAHLDACADPAAAVVARARAAGVERIVAVGSGIESCRETLAIAHAHPGVWAALGIHPHQAADEDANRLDELRALLADELREAARHVPADRILAETDSPYLAPVPRRGRPNEPANVVHTIAALAQARGENAAELAARIDVNATGAFSLPVASPAP